VREKLCASRVVDFVDRHAGHAEHGVDIGRTVVARSLNRSPGSAPSKTENGAPDRSVKNPVGLPSAQNSAEGPFLPEEERPLENAVNRHSVWPVERGAAAAAIPVERILRESDLSRG
jgi:hypothetical protein